eukprot:422349-Prymnesium_polylepis.2
MTVKLDRARMIIFSPHELAGPSVPINLGGSEPSSLFARPRTRKNISSFFEDSRIRASFRMNTTGVRVVTSAAKKPKSASSARASMPTCDIVSPPTCFMMSACSPSGIPSMMLASKLSSLWYW